MGVFLFQELFENSDWKAGSSDDDDDEKLIINFDNWNFEICGVLCLSIFIIFFHTIPTQLLIELIEPHMFIFIINIDWLEIG